jgi:hypothetical protein
MAGPGKNGVGSGLIRAPRHRDDLAARRDGFERRRVHDLGRDMDVLGEPPSQLLERIRIGGPGAEYLCAEAKRMLDRMEPLQYDEARGSPDAIDISELEPELGRSLVVADDGH